MTILSTSTTKLASADNAGVPSDHAWTFDEYVEMKRRRLLPAKGVELLRGRIIDAEFEDTPPAKHRWTFDDYTRISEAGLLDACRTELIDGRIVDMAPQRNLHWIAVVRTHQALQAVFAPPCVVASQGTHRFSRDFGPEPDVVVLPSMPSPRGYQKPHPLLVVKISDTTLAHDRGEKASLYAAHAVADYWIVNLIDRCIEVYRDPVRDQDQASDAKGGSYASQHTVASGESISPCARPNATIAADTMLSQ